MRRYDKAMSLRLVMKRFPFLAVLIVTVFLLAGCILGMKSSPPPSQHTTSEEYKLQVQDDPDGQLLTLRIGPVDVPVTTNHMVMSPSRQIRWTIPFDAWFIAYSVRVVDKEGLKLPVQPIHHVDFFNTARSDFICPRWEEAFFAAGNEMKDWPAVPGVGYRVEKGNMIRIFTMFDNQTNRPLKNIYLQVGVEYRLPTKVPELKNIYPAWFSVKECGNPAYDLKPGKSTTTGEHTMGYTGMMLAVGGHIHKYGQRLYLENSTRKESIAVLDSKPIPGSQAFSLPIVYLNQNGGYRLSRGDVVKVSAFYDNTTGRLLPRGAMGLVVGYFLPDDDSEFAALIRGKK